MPLVSVVTTFESRLLSPGVKRILALDGGGVRGIVSIAFLEKIEQLLKERSGRHDFRLSDYFDLVGGTSVGSLLATLIALGYPVADIKKLFKAWAPSIFRRPWFSVPGMSPRFSSRGLKRRTRELLRELPLECSELKTGLAMIAKRVDTGSPWVLTNNPRSKYWNDPVDGTYLGNRHYRIADLVRASAAAPSYFAPKRIRMMPRNARPRTQPGLFVDGAISPFNNPALMLLMVASMKGYGFRWELGPEKLLLVSVGTGSFRAPMESTFWLRNVPKLFAARALQGLITDSDTLTLTLMQWLAAPNRSWEINSEIGDLNGELLGLSDDTTTRAPLLSFVRYDVRLERHWLNKHIGPRLNVSFSETDIAPLKELDRQDKIDDLCRLSECAATAQVSQDDFPECFNQQ